MKISRSELTQLSALVGTMTLLFGMGYFVGHSAHGQTSDPQGYLKLREIFHIDTWDYRNRKTFHQNNEIQLNGNRGGQFTIISRQRESSHRDGPASERFLFEWSFGTDVAILRPGQKFDVQISAKMASPIMKAKDGDHIEVETNSSAQAFVWYQEDHNLTMADGYRVAHLLNTEVSTHMDERYYARPKDPGASVPDWKQFRNNPITVAGHDRFPRTHSGEKYIAVFTIEIIVTGYDNDCCRYEVVYIYDVITADPPSTPSVQSEVIAPMPAPLPLSFPTLDNALKMSVQLIPVDLRADLDGDGEVTAADARLIREAEERNQR